MQRGTSKFLLIIVLTLFISLLPLTFAACKKDVDVASIRVLEETVPQNERVSDFDITKVSLELTDSSGNLSNINASAVMLDTESKGKLKQGGNHSITLIYKQKVTSFNVTIFDDDAELVTVTFKDKNNNAITTKTTLKGGSVTPPSHPILEGMKAAGWTNSSNDAVVFENINNSIEVFAKYTEDIKTYTVTFKDFEGNTVGTVSVENNKIIPETPNYTQPEGIASWDWYFGNDKLNISTLKVTQNLSISMRVEYIKHTVTFVYKDRYNETITLLQEAVNHASSATGANDAIAMITNQGYNFQKWLIPFNNVRMDLTVEAQAFINSYDVIYLDYLGGEISRQKINYGDSATPPTNPSTPTGHLFTGEWDGGSLTNVTKNLTLTAKYEPRRIAITLIDGEAQIITRDFGTVITADTLGTLKTKPGNVLLGLYTDTNFNNKIELPYTITLNTSFYTKWVDTINGNSELVYSEIIDNTRKINTYNGNDAVVYIPNLSSNATVIGIDDNAFMDKNIIKIFFNENIKTIGKNAFRNTKLSGSIVLPDGLEEIGSYAFAGCTDIVSITIPASVKTIAAGAFEGASKLSSIIFQGESQLTKISDNVFFGCEKLENISLPATVATIGKNAFASSGLTAIALTHIKEIDMNAFKDCQSLVVASETALLERISAYAFSNTAITNINLGKIATLGEYAFANNKKLVTVNLGSKLKNLNSYVFMNCTKLTNITFHTEEVEEVLNGLENIMDKAFKNCSNLRTIILPITLKSISADAFIGNLKLTDITIDDANEYFTTLDGVLYNKDSTSLIVYPAGRITGEFIVPDDTKVIGKNAFVDATISKLVLALSIDKLEEKALYSRGISTIIFLGAVPNILNELEQEQTILSNELWKLFVPEELVDAYKAVTEFASAEAVPTTINSFYDTASGLSYIIVGETIKIVSASRQLTTITVPESIGGKAVTHILSNAFQNCDILTNVQINAKLVELGEYVFSGCTALTNISFSTIQRATQETEASIINLNAFEDTPWYNNTALVVVADTAFEYKYVLDGEGNPIQKTTLTIPNGVQVIYNNLFNNAAGNALKEIVLPQSLEIIREYAFKGSIITSLTIPSDVNKIEKGAFEDCTNLKTLVLRNSKIEEVSEKVFKNCNKLEEIILPATARSIGDEAFMNCSSLLKVTLSNALSQIGASAFRNCNSLPTISIPASVGVGIKAGSDALGDFAFAGCDSLVYIRIWKEKPASLGEGVFENTAFIYVESSGDGAILSDYKNQWSTYESQIKNQKDSPEITFVVDKNLNGETNKDLSHIVVEKMKTAVLYAAPTLPSVTGYIFVTWTYELAGNWVPVEYPFLVPQSTVIRARWVKTDEGSLSENDLTYNNAMKGYIINDYTGIDTKVVIPAYYKEYPIIAIADDVFNGNNSITEIRFATNSNITYIGKRSFANMANLVSIHLPASIIDIDDYAFAGSSLETIYIGKNVQSIGKEAFNECMYLDITFEANSELRYTELNAFEDTLWYTKQKENDETNFVIAGRLIIEYMKHENQNLVSLPNNAIAINKQLFMGDEDIVTIEIHEEIKFIGEKAFYNCSSLINISFGRNDYSQIEFVGENAFTGTPWRVSQEEFVLVGTVLVRYEGTATDVEIPNGITVIDKGAFAHKAIETIRLPNNLKTIAEKAFYDCNRLVSIVIPSQVTSIGKDAFRDNVSLKSLTFLGNNIKEIGEGAFYGCTSLGTDITKPILTLPSSLTSLGSGAFEGCSSLTNVNMQNSALTTLKSRTFYGANNLNTIMISSLVETIENDVFAFCTVLENITVGTDSKLKEIGNGAIDDTAWYNRSIVENQSYIMIYLGKILLKYRQNDSEKKNIVIPEQIQYIAENAFEDAIIASITFSNGLLEIGNYAFAGCEYLTNITITNNVVSIGEYAFSNCQRLETVYLGTGLAKIEASAFAGSSMLSKLVVNKMGYGQLTDDQYTAAGIAIDGGTIGAWFDANPEIFSGTELTNVNAFQNTSSFLRIYVIKDSRNINIAIYRYKWSSVSAKIYNIGDLPTISFVNVDGAAPLEPRSSELLQEQDLNTIYNGYTLLGWEAVIAAEDPDGVKITFPYKVIRDTTLRPIWLSNDRPVNDSFLGQNYTPNETSSAYLISSYNSTRDTLVIASKVNTHPLVGINSGVFTTSNTAAIKTVLFTQNDNLTMFTSNIFTNFTNLEKIIINGSTSYFVAVDGVLFTRDMTTLVAFPRALKINGEYVTEYTIPSTVVTILDYAFAGSKLKTLHIPSSVKNIGEGAFNNNNILEGSKYVGLSEIVFDTNSELQNVAYGAFDGSAWYKNISSEFRIAGTYLLSYSGFEGTVTIPSTIKTIGKRAFENSSRNNIIDLIIPASVVKINASAFSNCSNIESVIFRTDSNLMDIANNVFAETSWIANNINEFIIAGNVLVSYVGARDHLPLPNEVKVIGYNAFNNASFSTITLHNNLVSIGENAFFGCDNLTSITIPASVKEIGKSAFYSCLELSTFNFEENSNLERIGEQAFSYSAKLSAIAIPDTVKTIGASAFAYCSLLGTASLNSTSQLTVLGNSAFKNAKKLVSIFIPNGLSEINNSTFENCESLLTVTFSSTNTKLTTIGEYAFRGCVKLGSALDGKSSLLTLDLPSNVNIIKNGAFYDNSSLVGIRMQGQIVSIGANAFYNCAKLANVTIKTAQPPTVLSNSFNFSAHQKLRVYVNHSEDNTVLNAYKAAWGGDIVASTSKIFERNENNFPLVQIYDIVAGGDEEHLVAYDRRKELLTVANLPMIQDESSAKRGMSIGFYKSYPFKDEDKIFIKATYEIVQDEVLKLYVRWS